jgi:hypothetical protein
MTVTRIGVERGSEPPPEQPGHPPLLSLTAAARTAGVSRSTLRRRLSEGAFSGAQRDAQGAWLIPVTDLIQAGLSPAVTPPTSTPMSMPVNGVVSLPDLPVRVAELEAELATERLKREAAERLATERLDRVEDLRLALRALGPAPTDPARVSTRRRWWSRREG